MSAKTFSRHLMARREAYSILVLAEDWTPGLRLRVALALLGGTLAKIGRGRRRRVFFYPQEGAVFRAAAEMQRCQARSSGPFGPRR